MLIPSSWSLSILSSNSLRTLDIHHLINRSLCERSAVRSWTLIRLVMCNACSLGWITLSCYRLRSCLLSGCGHVLLAALHSQVLTWSSSFLNGSWGFTWTSSLYLRSGSSNCKTLVFIFNLMWVGSLGFCLTKLWGYRFINTRLSFMTFFGDWSSRAPWFVSIRNWLTDTCP